LKRIGFTGSIWFSGLRSLWLRICIGERCRNGCLDLSRFRSRFLSCDQRRQDMAATHRGEFKRDAVGNALSSGLARRQVASDLGVGLSTLGKWIRAISDEAKMPDHSTGTEPGQVQLYCSQWSRLARIGADRSCRAASRVAEVLPRISASIA